jgi:pimeloyl-ACP methyl ester carboxylesterase
MRGALSGHGGRSRRARTLVPGECPTLVMHFRDDPRVPSDLGRELAAGITGARFVALPGKNHVLLEQDPGLPRFFEELKDFLTDVS